MNRNLSRCPQVFILIGLLNLSVIAQFDVTVPLEEAPILYSQTQDNNRVSRLAEKIEAGQLELENSLEFGYLKSVLRELEISDTSQTLVFSKTSLQIRHISPRNPRAIYFNDDTYLGWVRGSSMMELATADPKLGAAFYLIDGSGSRPRIKRAGYDCLGCHATSMTQNVPGHAMRSVMASGDGRVETRQKSFLTELKTPFAEKFGGWYVTGQHGTAKHLGNAFVRGETIDTSRNSNVDRLEFEFDTRKYLSPYSDIVALMVLAHQIEMHNSLTKADFQIRKLEHDQTQGKLKLLVSERQLQIKLIATPVVDTLLFCGEQPLTNPISGREDFTKQFASAGPRDSLNRSLREFDLKHRLFKYPCSFLIHSAAFDQLNPALREEVMRQLLLILRGETSNSKYDHIDHVTKRNILDILLATKPDFASIAKSQTKLP
jgi:hypothetical protein